MQANNESIEGPEHGVAAPDVAGTLEEKRTLEKEKESAGGALGSRRVPTSKLTNAESDLEALRYSFWRGTVSFGDVATAWFNLGDGALPDALRRQFQAIFPGLLDAFAEPRKGIVTAYFCRHIPLAAVLTDIGHAAGAPEGVPEATLKGAPPDAIRALLPDNALEKSYATPHFDHYRPGRFRRLMWHYYGRGIVPASASALYIVSRGPLDLETRELLSECTDLHYRALEFLPPQQRKLCISMLFEVVTGVLAELDIPDAQGNVPVALPPAHLASFRRALDRAQTYFSQSARRQAQLEYYLGMGRALVLTFACAALTALVGSWLDWRFVENTAGQALLLSAALGATGSLISATTRLNSESFVLPRTWEELGRLNLRLMGSIRTFIGAMFGIVAYVLLAGGLLSVSGPQESDLALYFYAGVGFLAGFTERFAGDALSAASDRTGDARADESAKNPP